MGKKYIIEIPDDKIGDFIGSTHFLMPYMMAGHIGHHDTGLTIVPYTEPDLDAIRNEAYEKGVQDTKQHWADAPRSCAYKLGYENGLNDNDAWEAARKIYLPEDHGGLGYDMLMKIFNTDNKGWLFKNLSASEAIEKIRQYEQKMEEELGIQGYFKNGEEVIDADGTKAVILRVSEDNYCQVYTENGCIENWHIHTYKFHKTGRTFPEIAAVLRKMRETT